MDDVLGRDVLRQVLADGVFEGMKFVVDRTPLKPGDTYLAARNTGPHLLTVKSVDIRGWVYSVENAYPFDVYECVKIVFED